MRVRLKEDVYEAVQFTGENVNEVLDLFDNFYEYELHFQRHGNVLLIVHVSNIDSYQIFAEDYVVQRKPFNSTKLAPIIEVWTESHFLDRYEPSDLPTSGYSRQDETFKNDYSVKIDDDVAPGNRSEGF